MRTPMGISRYPVPSASTWTTVRRAPSSSVVEMRPLLKLGSIKSMA